MSNKKEKLNILNQMKDRLWEAITEMSYKPLDNFSARETRSALSALALAYELKETVIDFEPAEEGEEDDDE